MKPSDVAVLISIIDNPNGLPKPVLQLLEQENRTVHYVDATFGMDFSKVPLSFWERQIGSKLKEKSRLKEPKEPEIYHWKTKERIDEKIVQDFLTEILHNFIEDSISKDAEVEDAQNPQRYFPVWIIQLIPEALLSLKGSLHVLRILKEEYIDVEGVTASWLFFMTHKFFREYPAFFAA